MKSPHTFPGYSTLTPMGLCSIICLPPVWLSQLPWHFHPCDLLLVSSDCLSRTHEYKLFLCVSSCGHTLTNQYKTQNTCALGSLSVYLSAVIINLLLEPHTSDQAEFLLLTSLPYLRKKDHSSISIITFSIQDSQVSNSVLKTPRC